MPEAVKNFAEEGIGEVREIQEQILQTYEADFPKYNRRINIQRISRIFHASALSVGQKVIYSKLDESSTSRDIRRVIELLIDARVLLLVSIVMERPCLFWGRVTREFLRFTFWMWAFSTPCWG